MARRKSRRSSKAAPRGAFVLTIAVVALSFVLTVYSQATVQVTGRKELLDKAEGAWLLSREREIPAERGSIYSSDGRVLAQSQPRYDFWVFYNRVPCTPGFFMALSEAAGVPESRLSAPYRAGKQRTWLEHLDEARYRAVRRVMADWGADGVSLAEENGRAYPMREAAVGIVGWMHDGKPKSGVESAFDKELSGRDGRARGVVGLNGGFMAETARDHGLEHGADVVLTIDSRLQTAATRAIRTAVEKNLAVSGSAIVLVPSTGDVLAMASWPTFDPVDGPRGGTELMTSYMEDFEPGSTFKVLTLAKALDAGVVDSSSKVNCSGVFDLGRNRLVRCDEHNGTRGHGLVGLERAIGKSCNVSAAKWALGIGRGPMIEYMRRIGLLSKPSINLPGSVSPLFNMDEYDKERQLAVVGFGQSIAVPPINLAGALAMLANGGEYVAPRIVSHVGGERRLPAAPVRVVSPSAAQAVMGYMESVVQSDFGTGKLVAIPGYRIAGKTGTAQKLGKGGNISSFVGVFPAEDPKALILVMVNEPKAGQIYGSLVAGPAFRELALAVISRLQIARSRPSDKTSKEGP